MFHGSMVALVTPMQADGAIDWDRLNALVDWHVEQGTDAIVAVGTTGESATLDEEEHCRAIRAVVERAAGRIPVIAGTGANSTTEAISLTRCAMEAGADACLLVTPYYNKPPQEGLYQHFRAIAEAVAIPQILYNVPGRTSVDMSNDTVDRLADLANVVGIKDATGDLDRGRELIERCGNRIDVYSGDDGTAMELILAGAKGNISVTANVDPAGMHGLCAAALAGEREKAAEINDRLSALNGLLFCESNPIPVKWALQEMGRIPGGIRLPLVPMAAEHEQPLRDALRGAGLL